MKKLQAILVAFVLTLMMTACSAIDGLIPNLGPHVQVKSISLINGITLSIKGVDCSFSFTTDRDTLLGEVKRCLVGDEHRRGIVMSAPPMYDENGDLIEMPEPEVAEIEVDEETEKEAERIADEIIKALESAKA